MQYPSHLILDVVKRSPSLPKRVWVSSYQAQLTKDQFIRKDFSVLTNNSVLRSIKVSNSQKVLKTSKIFTEKNKPTNSLNELFFLLDINFLRKERLYTKLKYSRCPQYDIVSGGCAALFAGLLAFLITEKFGIELVDSGDFYFLLMYAIFLALALKPLLHVISKTTTNSWTNPLNSFFLYYYHLITLLLTFIKSVSSANFKKL